MRIGLFSDTFPPEVNGVAISVMTLQQELINHGHDVFVITTHPSLIHIQKDGNILRLPGVEVKKLYGYVVTQPFQLLAIAEIKSMRLDIIHVHTEFGVGIYARLIGYFLKIPVVGTYHTTYEEYTHYVLPVKIKTVDKFARKTVAQFSKVTGDSCLEMITPSEKTKELLESYHIRKPINVIPTGIDLRKFDPSSTSEKILEEMKVHFGLKDAFVILFVGRIASEKNIDVIIKAMPMIIEKHNNAHLMVVGGGPSLDDYKNLANSLGVSKSITFVGKIASAEVPKYYHLADVFVSASMSETQGLTFIEALSSGLVVLASDSEVVQDLVVEGVTGYLFTGSAMLADKIDKFINLTTADQQLMHQEAFKVVGVFNGEIFYQKVMDVYQRVVSNYSELYQIIHIRYIKDSIELTLKNNFKKMKLIMNIDSYYELGIRKEQVLTNELVESMLFEHEKVDAYNRCLRKISFKDKTTKEMYDFLTKNTSLNIKSINDIVDKLYQQGYIDDRRYVLEYIAKRETMFFGKNKIIQYLAKKGIHSDVVKELLHKTNESQEIDLAVQYAEKIADTIKGKSLEEKKRLIIQRLYRQGFSLELSKQAIADINFKHDKFKEISNLEKDAKKVYLRYSRKYQDSKLRNNVFRYLSLKGYRYEDIYVVLDKMEWKNEN